MQNTPYLLMIKPVHFGFNDQTAVNNVFQKKIDGNIQQKALQEFNDLVTVLRKNKVDVMVIEDTAEPPTPDSLFPNNWISFHDDGRIFLYPMFAPNRRQERKVHVINTIKNKFMVSAVVDLGNYELQDLFLEGTGSMVFDRENKIAYACISPRTNEQLLNEFCRLTNFSPVTFRSTDSTGVDIYHTNVMMCMADTYAVICLESVPDDEEKKKIVTALQKTNKEIIDISLQQLSSFAGNMLQVRNVDSELLLVMSTQAFESLTPSQINTLEKYNHIIHSSLNTIETVGGGSARCMMAEVFLEKK
jgi:hypothetical protein